MRLVLCLSALATLATAQTPKDLGRFYQQNCVRCHGADGSARDAAGQKLRGTDLTDPAWSKAVADETIVTAILKGKFFGLAMPAYKKELTREEALQMAREVVRKAEKGKPIGPSNP